MIVKFKGPAGIKLKKRNGTLEDMLVPILVVLAISILMVSFLHILSLISLKENVKEIARKYILEMETKGYLSAESELKMRQELMSIGMTDIALNGTTYTDVGYGNEIHLYISGNLPTKTLDTAGADETVLLVQVEDYMRDVSLKGEFVRQVMEDPSIR